MAFTPIVSEQRFVSIHVAELEELAASERFAPAIYLDQVLPEAFTATAHAVYFPGKEDFAS